MKEIPEIMAYFSDYNKNEYPERQYMFDILFTLKSDVIEDMIQSSRKKRGIVENIDNNEMIEITKEYWNEIFELANIKGKYN